MSERAPLDRGRELEPGRYLIFTDGRDTLLGLGDSDDSRLEVTQLPSDAQGPHVVSFRLQTIQVCFFLKKKT